MVLLYRFPVVWTGPVNPPETVMSGYQETVERRGWWVEVRGPRFQFVVVDLVPKSNDRPEVPEVRVREMSEYLVPDGYSGPLDKFI